MEQLSVNVVSSLSPRTGGAELEKELEREQLQTGYVGPTQATKRRTSRPMLWLGNISSLPYVIRTAVWPSSRKTSET